MALLTAQPVTLLGLTPVFTVPSVSDTVAGGDNVFMYIKVGSTATTVTIVRAITSNFGEQNNFIINAGPITSQDRMVGPLNASQGFINPNTGLVNVTLSQVTGVTNGYFIF